MLLEYRLASELKARGELRAIFPVFVGEPEVSGSLGEGYGDFFEGGGKPQARDVHVNAVEAKVQEHLVRGARGSPTASPADCTVKGVLDAICKHQGVFLKGAPKSDAVEKVVGKLARISDSGDRPTSPRASTLASRLCAALATREASCSSVSSSTTTPVAPLPEGKKSAAFLSHYKAECSMEARFVQEKLESALSHRVFLDSDYLTDLSKLKQHVRESSVLILLQSKNVLTRPYCLLELLTALSEGVPVVCLAMVGGTAHYDYAENAKLLTYLDTKLEQANPGAGELLKAEGWPDLTDVAYLLATTIPSRVSISFQAGGSRKALAASLDDLMETVAHAKAADLDDLPLKEQWLARRGRSRSFVQHGSVAASLSVDPSVSMACVPDQVPELPSSLQRRPELLQELMAAVLQPQGTSGAIVVALHGLGGSGKSTLAAELINTAEIADSYDKLCWGSVGQAPNLERLQLELHLQLTEKPFGEDARDPTAKLKALRKAAAGMRVFCVLDDIWDAKHAAALDFVDRATCSARVVTTRVRELLPGAVEIPCNLLSTKESLQMLLRCGKVEALLANPPQAALEAIELCGRLPLTLAIAGSLIRDLADSWETELVPALSQDHAAELRHSPDGDTTITTEERIISASFRCIKESERPGVLALFSFLGIFPEDAVVNAGVFDALAPLIVAAAVTELPAPPSDSQVKPVSSVKLRVRRWLQELLRHSLLMGSIASGLQTHDVVRDIAASRAEGMSGGLHAMQHSALLVFLEALTAGDPHSPASACTQQLVEYVRHHLRHHVSGALQPGMQVQDDELLMRALCRESDDVRAEAAHGIGRERLEAAIGACEASGRWLDAGELLWAASVRSGLVVAGEFLFRARNILRHATETESSLRLEERILRAVLQGEQSNLEASSPFFLSSEERIAASSRFVEVSQAVAGNQVEALLSQALAAQQNAIAALFTAARLGKEELQQAMGELLQVSVLRRKASELASGAKAAAIRRNARVPLMFSPIHDQEGWSWEAVCGIDGVDVREDIKGYVVADHVEAKAFKGDLFMWGYHGVGTLLWQGDLETTHDFFAKTIEAWRQVKANVRAGSTTWDKYFYEVQCSYMTLTAFAFAANKIDMLVGLRKHHLSGLVLSDETLLPVFQTTFPKSWETLLLMTRAIDALIKPDTAETRVAIQEWLPGAAVLIKYAKTEGGPFLLYAASCMCGPAHPALLCARLHGERLGNWELAAEVTQAMAEASANPYNRIEALRLLSRATKVRNTACKALEQALGDARKTGYAWCEMQVLHDLLERVDSADVDAVASTREQLLVAISRLRCSTSDLSVVLGVDVETLLQGDAVDCAEGLRTS